MKLPGAPLSSYACHHLWMAACRCAAESQLTTAAVTSSCSSYMRVGFYGELWSASTNFRDCFWQTNEFPGEEELNRANPSIHHWIIECQGNIAGMAPLPTCLSFLPAIISNAQLSRLPCSKFAFQLHLQLCCWRNWFIGRCAFRCAFVGWLSSFQVRCSGNFSSSSVSTTTTAGHLSRINRINNHHSSLKHPKHVAIWNTTAGLSQPARLKIPGFGVKGLSDLEVRPEFHTIRPCLRLQWHNEGLENLWEFQWNHSSVQLQLKQPRNQLEVLCLQMW